MDKSSLNFIFFIQLDKGAKSNLTDGVTYVNSNDLMILEEVSLFCEMLKWVLGVA